MSAGARRAGLLLLAITALQPVLHAAEAAPAEPSQAPGQADAAPSAASPDGAPPDPTSPGQQDAMEVPASEDVFVPTVEVSEDTSVPFPVDI